MEEKMEERWKNLRVLKHESVWTQEPYLAWEGKTGALLKAKG